MAERWVLNRAGIVNVYQYGDETIELAGGRLLLRGVNGSGKSTAMNMLLPFLFEADTRRIDAAGEQAGVLRSWMLSGRDEQQPQGYLWIELRRGSEHLTCGCGIRANRSTERVTTWWFLTGRRPGIDLALVQQRTPITADALRAELGPDGAVYAHDQRPAYRADLAQRLYGGADLDQHLRLLHVVRSPRVGDRIDHDLPSYLEGALPQLSESALDDAAQPLEDLEQHRRNVEDLSATATALGALATTYRAYARTEIHRRAADALAVVADADRRRRAESSARTAHRAALDAEEAAVAAIDRAESERRRLEVEIEALKASDAYRSGAELVDLRAHVQSLDARLTTARKELDHRDQRLAAALDAVGEAAAATERAGSSLAAGLTELARLAAHVGLTARPPAVPVAPTAPAAADGSGASDPPLVPAVPVDVEGARGAVRAVSAAATTRRADVDEVYGALAAAEGAERELDRATRAHADAEHHHQQAGARLGDARQAVRDTTDTWRVAIDAWVAALDAHRRAAGLEPVDLPAREPAGLADRHAEVRAALLDAAQATADEHGQIRSRLQARRDTEAAAVATARAVVDELTARSVPAVPVAGWQRGGDVVRFADLVDFDPALDDDERAGLEAALEAAGLLGAEVRPDGALVLDDGTLAARPGAAAPTSLVGLLTVTVPDDRSTAVDPDAVARLLASISTEPDDLDRPAEATAGAATVVTTDGRFRLGVLRGRHTKATAEHVGVTARRAALARQREAAARSLADAETVLAATEDELAVVETHRAAAVHLRGELPTDGPIVGARATATSAAEALERAADALDAAALGRDRADAAFATAVDDAQRRAATLGLPPDRSELDQIVHALRDVAAQCRDTERDLADLRDRASTWRARGDDWAAAAADRERAAGARRELEDEHEPLATRLSALEDAIGLEYEAVVAALAAGERDLADASVRLQHAQAARLDARGHTERAQADLDRAVEDRRAADERSTTALPGLRAALAVDGLLRAAVAADGEPGPGRDADDGPTPAPIEPALPVVTDSPDGLRELARAAAALVPPPDTEVRAENVRLSLRARRATLGAGWDAEDHQPDEDLPVRVEVNGPLGRSSLADAVVTVGAQLRRMTSLLSAKQDQALRNLLQGLIAREVADKLHAAGQLVARMNARLDTISTTHGIGVSLRWRRRDDLDPDLVATIALLAKPPDLRTPDEDQRLAAALAERIAAARAEDPELPYRELVASVLDYRSWHRLTIVVRRPGRDPEVLGRRTALSEGEKKMVSYLPLFAAVAASCDALADHAPDAPRFVLLDDAFAKVSEDNHPKLFGLLVELDLDVIATSERLWGTYATVPELAITEVLRDAELGVIVLEHSRWDGTAGRLVAP